MDNLKNKDSISEQKATSNSSTKYRYKMLLAAFLVLAAGFGSGYFVGLMRQDKSTAQNIEQISKENSDAEQAEEEIFEAAPILQAPEKKTPNKQPDEPIKVVIQDSVITTYSYEGTDNKTYTKRIIMSKAAVTNTSKEPLQFDVYPINLKDKNKELMNATFYAFMPEELSWYGGFLHTQTIPAGDTVIGVITFEVPADINIAARSPLQMQLEKLNKTFEVNPREVVNPNN